jgi:hypothetical protein
VVVTIAPVKKLGLATATQFDEEPHETPVRPDAPVGTVWLVHVTPPLALTTMIPVAPEEPTATQSDTDAQDTPEKPETARPVGRV